MAQGLPQTQGWPKQSKRKFFSINVHKYKNGQAAYKVLNHNVVTKAALSGSLEAPATIAEGKRQKAAS
jgi:hypothetical protein